MPIIAKAGGGSFAPAPAGTHSAVCCDVVDLGVLEVNYAGKTKRQHKITVIWQIGERRDDDKLFLLRKRYTLSLHEKASLRKDLESWRGRSFTPAELEGFDIETLLGVPCLLSVIHQAKDGDIFANISAIMRLPKGMEALKVVDYVRVCDREPTQAEPTQPQWGGMEITDDDVPF